MQAVLKPGLGQSERSAQPGAAGTDDNDVIAVINEFVVAHAPSPIFKIAKTAAAASRICAKRDKSSAAILRPGACT